MSWGVARQRIQLEATTDDNDQFQFSQVVGDVDWVLAHWDEITSLEDAKLWWDLTGPL